ncbi:MAG: nucleoside deaminase [Anaerolineales bacterium]
MTENLPDRDEELLRRTFALATAARGAGNHPFGALLADPNGDIVLEALNTVVIDGDVTAHAERNLITKASMELGADSLREHTLYSSTEPCPMCAGAIHWGGVGRIVYGLSQEGLYAMSASGDPAESFLLGCRQVFAASGHDVKVVGPCLEAGARQPHIGFWQRDS